MVLVLRGARWRHADLTDGTHHTGNAHAFDLSVIPSSRGMGIFTQNLCNTAMRPSICALPVDGAKCPPITGSTPLDARK